MIHIYNILDKKCAKTHTTTLLRFLFRKFVAE